MNSYIGIDLGTSSVKLILMNSAGDIINTVTRDYPVYYPLPGWSEQDPGEWKNAVLDGLRELLDGQDASSVKGIGCAGQMHGLVILDEDDEVIRPAILWNDSRTEKETAYLNEVIGREKLSELTANIAFAGFTAPKLLWVKNNEPENFNRIKKIMLPKDYINYILTGVFSCDFSDASGMLLLDVKNRCWSREMTEICGVSDEQLPRLYESYEVTGTVKKEIADLFGMSYDVKVVAGAGDNAAAAIGTGITGEGGCNISIGTSGTVFISSVSFRSDPNNALHAFAHADGGWHLMGCMLSAASCTRWLLEDILETNDYDGELDRITDDELGSNRVFFLPYLMGERSPINDTSARGTFTGMTLNTKRRDMELAVLEGIAFAVRDMAEVAKSIGVEIPSSMICGGGIKSPVFRKILANVLGIPLCIPRTEMGPGMGAVILAMTACGEYASVKDACDTLVTVTGTVMPDKDLTERYEKKYQSFRRIYPAMKELFRELKD